MRPHHFGSRHHRLAAMSLVATLSALNALAQSPTTAPALPAPSPAPVQPAPSTPPSTALRPAVTINPQLIIGRWKHVRTDPDTRTSDTLIIEFLADGSYQAKNRHSLFPTPERPSQGRYSIANVGPSGFDLRIERHLVDPESDPAEAVEVQRITVVDLDSLQAADGSIVRRIRE